MKRLLLTILSVMALAGMTVAQDVYSSGYYTSGGDKYAAVYKNNTKLYEFHVSGYNYEGTDVIRFNGDTYWSFNSTSNNNIWAAVFKNGNRFLDLDVSSTSWSGRSMPVPTTKSASAIWPKASTWCAVAASRCAS